jgi:hypothetical protein
MKRVVIAPLVSAQIRYFQTVAAKFIKNNVDQVCRTFRFIEDPMSCNVVIFGRGRVDIRFPSFFVTILPYSISTFTRFSTFFFDREKRLNHEGSKRRKGDSIRVLSHIRSGNSSSGRDGFSPRDSDF